MVCKIDDNMCLTYLPLGKNAETAKDMMINMYNSIVAKHGEDSEFVKHLTKYVQSYASASDCCH